MELRLRSAVRALIVDPDDHALLVKFVFQLLLVFFQHLQSFFRTFDIASLLGRIADASSNRRRPRAPPAQKASQQSPDHRRPG